MTAEWVHSWFEASAYATALGVELRALSGEAAELALPYDARNSNPGGVLHGGVAASLSAMGAHAVARAALGESSGPWHTYGMQINYLAAAQEEDVVAHAKLLRQGKELCFSEVHVATQTGKPIAQASAAVRGCFGEVAKQYPQAVGDDGSADPGVMGPHIGSLPFVSARGICVEHMQDSHSRLVMPCSNANADRDGGVHEGALLALLDTTGAMASWAATGPGRFKASTASLQAQLLVPPPKQDLVAYGRVAARDGAFFWSDVEVATASDQQLVARGTVLYRIVA